MTVKLAVTYQDGQVFQHFGKTKEFKIYDVADGKVGFSMVVSPGGQGHAALAGFLRMLGISAVLCGGIGPGAVEALQRLDITPIAGVTGDADQAAADFVAGKLTGDTAALLAHRHRGGPDHDCGACHGGCGESGTES